ncbi:hypothetical protein ACIQZM_13380 [Peribacillus sp. NPDC097206]|uniref:hypothetical protein n=1 Tax=unclassified Peribacillus TaxID=2675266 RepID=UPI0037FA808F
MNRENQHILNVIDFIKTGHNTCFVKVVGYDADAQVEFEGEIKFVRERPFGDLIHPERSQLTPSSREFVRDNLINRYNKGEFN